MSAPDDEIGYEAVGWIRDAAMRVMGTNCTWVDEDLHALEHLAQRAVDAGLVDGLPASIQKVLAGRKGQ